MLSTLLLLVLNHQLVVVWLQMKYPMLVRLVSQRPGHVGRQAATTSVQSLCHRQKGLGRWSCVAWHMITSMRTHILQVGRSTSNETTNSREIEANSDEQSEI